WHISLSMWLRDYIYFPLGGSKRGKLRKYINIAVVFLISGLWHGTGLTFLVWGILHGFMRITGEILLPLRKKIASLLKINRDNMSNRFLRVAVTFFMVTFNWIFFRALSLRQALDLIKSSLLIRPWELTDGTLFNYSLDAKDFNVIVVGLIIMGINAFISEKKYNIKQKILEQGIWFKWLLFYAAIIGILIFGIYGPGYNNANFMYFNF
ncbi:MAG: MBOAT family protein, partial [Lachnospiraceae bacterium]|nr:MBOAT family protein [Lachnospiraceae bacterium]